MKPTLVVCLGVTAAQILVERKARIVALRGQLLTLDGGPRRRAEATWQAP